jgi:hypothetical protein
MIDPAWNTLKWSMCAALRALLNFFMFWSICWLSLSSFSASSSPSPCSFTFLERYTKQTDISVHYNQGAAKRSWLALVKVALCNSEL